MFNGFNDESFYNKRFLESRRLQDNSSNSDTSSITVTEISSTTTTIANVTSSVDQTISGSDNST